MSKYFLFSLFITLFLVQHSFAQSDLKNKSILITVTGDTLNGRAELSELERSGVVTFFSQSGDEKSFDSSSGISVILGSGRKILSKEITFSDSENKTTSGFFFAESLVTGEADLYKVYNAPYRFALGKAGRIKALQIVTIEEDGKDQKIQQYKGALYMAFSDCFELIETRNTDLSEESLSLAFNQYNACKDPDYDWEPEVYVDNRRWFIETNAGFSHFDFSFSITNIPSFNPDFVIHPRYFEKRRQVYEVLAYRGLLKNHLMLGTGISYRTIEWGHQYDYFIDFDDIIFKELSIPFRIKVQKQFSIFTLGVFAGKNINFYLAGLTGEENAEILADYGRITVYYSDSETGKKQYWSTSYGYSGYLNITQTLEFGMKYQKVIRPENILSEGSSKITDSFPNETSILLSLRYGF